MIQMIWPLGLVVLSNAIYHICAKSVSSNINPFASLTFTYIVGGAVSFILFLIMGKGTTITQEFAKLNWASILLGIAIVGLEAGFLFTYRAGWQISVASIVQSAALAVVLIFVGWLVYKEALTWNKLLGVVICLVGLYFINKQ